MSRRFSHHGEDRSRNLCTFGSDESLDTGARPPVALGWAERVHPSYSAYCATVGAKPAAFDAWRLRDYGVKQTDLNDRVSRAQFRGCTPAEVVDSEFLPALHSEFTSGYYEPPTREWNGSLDNAIEALEELQ